MQVFISNVLANTLGSLLSVLVVGVLRWLIVWLRNKHHH